MHQILAELYPFESFYKLFAAYCLEVIVSKCYFIIDIYFFFFLQITKVMAIWASYLFFYAPAIFSGGRGAYSVTFVRTYVRPVYNTLWFPCDIF